MGTSKTPTNKRSLRKAVNETLEGFRKEFDAFTGLNKRVTDKVASNLIETDGRTKDTAKRTENLTQRLLALEARVQFLESRLIKNRLKYWIRSLRSKSKTS
jgi:hypothetical protein